MRLYLNGEELEVPEGVTLSELIKSLNIQVREVGFAVAVNEEVVPKSKYESHKLSDGRQSGNCASGGWWLITCEDLPDTSSCFPQKRRQ
jgi:sulfur carrier protein